MMRSPFSGFVMSLVLLGLVDAKAPSQTPPVDKDHAAKMARGLERFKSQIRTVLVDKCLKCHGGKTVEAGLDLSDRERLLKGGESGPAILVGKGKESLLYKLSAHLREPHMPHQGRKLADEVLSGLASWIDDGAPYDAPLIRRAAPEDWTKKAISPEAKQWWAYQPLKRPSLDSIRNDGWCRTPVDRFLLARMEAAGVAPSPPVDRRRLIRRAYYDLIGLPPSPQEVEAFVNDSSPDAYPRLIDRLLESPRYGERWARHWLDLARFAESHGFEHDYDRPTAYTYRDFVVKAFNQGMPYDRFVKWQIAGDEFEPNDPLALSATGFLAAGVHSTQITKNEVERHRYDEMDDKLSTLSSSLLGLTVGCARCHDHKYDAIPQSDYYRMLATFTTTVRSEVELDFDPEGYKKAKEQFDREHEPFVAALKKYEAEVLPGRLAEWEKDGKGKVAAGSKPPPANVAAILAVAVEKRTAAQVETLRSWFKTTDAGWQKLSAKAKEHEGKAPKRPRGLICTEGLPAVRLHTQGEDFLPQTHFLRRGDPGQKEGVANPSFLQVLLPSTGAETRWQKAPPPGSRTSHRRRALAEWLTDVDQGAGALLARVMVNRLWHRHMGRGIVTTVSDFGTRGEKPTHPELLDWLALSLIEHQWQIKPIHKLLMTSAAYMQESRVDETHRVRDRDNRLFARYTTRRLEGEAIRDALLAVGGALDQRMYGPGTLDEGSQRRSLYFTVKRSKLIPMLQIFDAPDALSSLGERPTTTIAPQALYLMNNAQVRRWAHGFARRITGAEAASVESAVEAAYRIALSRSPTAQERQDAVAFVQSQEASYRDAGRQESCELALTDLCQTLLCLNEFVYVD